MHPALRGWQEVPEARWEARGSVARFPVILSFRSSFASIQPFAPLQFILFVGCHAIDHMRRNAELADDSIVKDADTAGCDGSHSQFFVTGYAELSDDKHIEGRV